MLGNIDLDVHILLSIYKASLKGKNITTWQIAKEFNWEDKERFVFPVEKQHFYLAKTALVTRRIESMEKEGFVKIDRTEGNKKYILLGPKILKKHKFHDGYKLSFQFKSKRGKWVVFEI